MGKEECPSAASVGIAPPHLWIAGGGPPLLASFTSDAVKVNC